jgi:SHS family lactate transporter-like MFS transporter
MADQEGYSEKVSEQQHLENVADGVPHDHHYEHMSVGQYAATRITSLKPPMTKIENPIRLLRMLNRQQWAFFAVCYLGEVVWWTGMRVWRLS